jgi:hypothetical protein
MAKRSEALANPTTKAGLIEQVRAQYAALDAATAPILPAQMAVPGVNGAWSAKDTVAHLTFWHQNLLARLSGAATNLHFSASTEIDDDTWNLRCFTANRDRALDDIMTDLRRTQQAILDAIEGLPEAMFFNAGEHGGALWEAVDGTVLGHYPEHIAQVERWRAQHITAPTMKSDLLYRIAEGYGALAATVMAMPPRELTLPTLHGGWSAKDEVAHVTFWEARALTIVRAALTGDEPRDRSGIGSAEKIDAMNADVFAASCQRGLDDVLAAMEETHAAFVHTVAELPEDALFDARRFPWTEGESLAVTIAGDSYDHYPEHTRNIQRWRAVRSVERNAR